MGKIKLEKKFHSKNLGGQIEEHETSTVQPKLYSKPPKKKKSDDKDESIDDGLSKKILSEARLQQRELAENEAPPATHNLVKKKKAKDPVDDSDDDSESESEDEVYEPVVVDEGEDKLFNKFLNPSSQPTRTLADIIKIGRAS